MNYIGGTNYQGMIPGFPAGTKVTYYISTFDSLTGRYVTSHGSSYNIFNPTGANTLVVFNGYYSDVNGYPQSYYFGSGDWPNSYATLKFDHDTWAYGPLTTELVNNYSSIIEICSGGPNDINNNVIRTWLSGNINRNYMLAGDDWLGSQTAWRDTTYEIGSFQYDILGINADHNDINYVPGGDYTLPSIVYPQPVTLLGGNLYDLYNKVTADSGWTSPMTYDPYYEISANNWLDGIDFESDVEVDMKGLASDSTTIYNIGGHRTLKAGNKIVFFAFDPLSLNSDSKNQIEYYWYGFTLAAPQVQVLDWFGIPVEVEQESNEHIPTNFSLAQNYPNPFNPSTKISYTIPNVGTSLMKFLQFVQLKVYDVLGREVATLVNEEKTPGKYEVNFDASKISSGVYFYRLNAGSFIGIKKMILLR